MILPIYQIKKLISLRDMDGRKLRVRKIETFLVLLVSKTPVVGPSTRKDRKGEHGTCEFLSYLRGTPFASSEPYLSKESSGEFTLIKNDE
jgi:hypothetical protein